MISKKFIARVSDDIADELLLQEAISEMRTRLKERRQQGKLGWHRLENCDKLKQRLISNVESGDFIDVLNLAAMIVVHNNLYGDMNEKPR